MMQYGRLGGPGWSMSVSVIIAVLSTLAIMIWVL
jgi:hypothetical protein